jgi:PAS domain S-box-containing protein
MKDKNKKKEQLIKELQEMRQQIAALREGVSLRESERRLADIIDFLPDATFAIDRDGTVIAWNRAMEEITGIKAESILGKGDYEYSLPFYGTRRPILVDLAFRFNDEIEKKYHFVKREGDVLLAEAHVPVKDEYRELWGKAGPLYDSRGNVVGAIESIRDITERKQAEEELRQYRGHLEKLVEERTIELKGANEKLRQEMADRIKMEEELLRAHKLESVGILAGGIAHDFNNLLAAIMGYVELAKSCVHPGDVVYQTLARAEKSCLRASELTKQLITFSKGGAPLRRWMSLPELLRDLCDRDLRGSNIRCDLSLPNNLWPVFADEGQLRQVVHHLLQNAMEAMPEGGVITVRALNRTVSEYDELPLKDGRYVAWSVEDHGVGITEENLTKVFDPYFTTKDRYDTKGMGLGLAICYSVIKRHKGLITVVSEPGSRTSFTIYLPAAIPEGAAEAVAKGDTDRRDIVEGATVRKGRILVMDDEKIVRDLMKLMLDQLGYDVEIAKDGDEAIALYKNAKELSQPFAMVILNLTIRGGMGGEFAIKKLLQIDPHVKAIAVSGYIDDHVLMNFREHGFKGAISKPFTLEKLGNVLDNARSMKGE